MTYNPIIPQPSNNLSDSQGQMLTNFGQANTIFGADHYTFDDTSLAKRGFHKKVTLDGAATPPTPAAGFGDIYGATNGASVTVPFYRRDGLGATPEFSMLPIRAFATFDGTTNAIIGNAMNITGISGGGGTLAYKITMPANVVTGLTYSILASHGGTTPKTVLECSVISATQFQVSSVATTGSAFTIPPTITVAVLQL